MKAKVIYREGYSDYKGEEKRFGECDTIIEFHGRYYKYYSSGLGEESISDLTEIEFDPNETIEEYRDVGRIVRDYHTVNFLKLGKGEEIEIDLLSLEEVPDSLKEEYENEFNAKRIKRVAEVKAKLDPVRSDVEKLIKDLPYEQQRLARELMDKIEQEMIDNEKIEMLSYQDIFENIDLVVKGEAIIVTHTEQKYDDKSGDRLVTLDSFKDESTALASSGKQNDRYEGETYPKVVKIGERRVKLEDGSFYLGSFWEGKHVLDLKMNEDGKLVLSEIVDKKKYNEHFYTHYTWEIIERFEISTGKEESFKEINDSIKEDIAEQNRFIQETSILLSLPEEQVKKILDYAEKDCALLLAIELYTDGTSEKSARALAEQKGYEGLEMTLKVMDMGNGRNELEDIKHAADAVLYIYDLQREELSASVPEVIDDVRIGEITNAINIISINERIRKKQNDKTKTDN